MTTRVAILGAGNVGQSLVQLIDEGSERIKARSSAQLEIVGVGVRDCTKVRDGIDPALITDDLESLVGRPDVDVVVELIGGLEPARSLIVQALKAGKAVVSANKELIAREGHDLVTLGATAGTRFVYEAAVGGGIPVLRSLRESLIGEKLLSITGIVNGTTNYILTQMTENGSAYEDALKEAQQAGFAEAVPDADTEGFDAAAKGRVLAQLGFDSIVDGQSVLRVGISKISVEDIEAAARLGYVIKPVVQVQRNDKGQVGVGAYPAMVAHDHPLASVRNSFNALFIKGESVEDLMFYGRGAGGLPTATAVLGDVIDVAVDRKLTNRPRTTRTLSNNPWPAGELQAAFYLTLHVADKPGVLSQVAKVFGDHDISIRSMEQLGLRDEARLLFITHVSREKDMNDCLEAFAADDVVIQVGNVMRVLV